MNEYDEQKHTLRNHLQQLESQLADVLGDLDAAAEAHPENQIRALGARLRYLEMRRSAEARLLWQTDVAAGQEAALRGIADSLRKAVDRLLEPPADHTVIKARGLGMQIHASGRAGDPVFAEAAKEVEKLTARLTELREDVLRHEIGSDQALQALESCRALLAGAHDGSVILKLKSVIARGLGDDE